MPKPRIAWNDHLFFEVMKVQCPETVWVAKHILQWQRIWQDGEAWGNGAIRGSFRPYMKIAGKDKSYCKIYTVFGGKHPVIYFEMKYIRRLAPFHLSTMARTLVMRLNALDGVNFHRVEDRHSIDLRLLRDRAQLDIFKDVVRFVVYHIRLNLESEEKREAGRYKH